MQLGQSSSSHPTSRWAFFVAVPILVVAVVLSHGGKAGTVSESTYEVHTSNRKTAFRLKRFTNENDAVQVEASFIERHGWLPNTQRPVLYGRDLDGDQYPETWVFRDNDYIENVYYYAPPAGWTVERDAFGTDALGRIVEHLELNERWYAQIATETAVGWVLSAVSGVDRAWDDFFRIQLNVFELQIRADQLTPGSEEAIYLDALAERAWTLGQEEVQKEIGIRYWKRGAIDMATWMGGMKAMKWAGKAQTWIAKKVSASAAGKAVATTLGEFSQKITERAAALARRLKLKPAQIAQAEATAQTAAVTAYGLNLTAARAAATQAIRSLATRNKFASLALNGLAQGGAIYKRGFGNWKYVIQTQISQILAEGWARRAEIYDPNPIVMTQKLFTDEEFLQNFGYMTHETIVQNGVHTGPGSVRRRLAVAGVLSLFNSAQMNLLIKGNLDVKRVGIDSGWEVLVGNLQSLLDASALQYFDQLATKTRSPKLRLVGYAIAFVDQTAGFFAYTRTMSALMPPETVPAASAPLPAGKLELRLVPILAPLP